MKKQKTFIFHNWFEPHPTIPGNVVTTEKQITLTYEKGLIRKNMTDKIIPSTEEGFDNMMKTYANMPDVTEI